MSVEGWSSLGRPRASCPTRTMIKRGVAFGAAVLTVASVLIGAFYGWMMALGVFWFGASFLVLVVVMKSFSKDVSSRLGEP